MYQKRPGVFMADWWDADGRRHRKQFSNSQSAREHEHRETALAHAERASRELKMAAKTGGVRRHRLEANSGTMEAAKGKLGVMIPGMGAVATTFVAGVEAIRKGLAKPIGSLTQLGTVRLGKRTEGRSPKIKEFVPLAGLDDLVFTGWDIFEDNMYESASNAGVLDYRLLEQLKPFLSTITPRAAVFDHNFLVLDTQPTGPDFTATFPYQPSGDRDFNGFAEIRGNQVVYLKPVADGKQAASNIMGYGPTADDYDVRVENHKTGAGIRIRGDRPLSRSQVALNTAEPTGKVAVGSAF